MRVVAEWRHTRPGIQIRYEVSVEVPRRGVKWILLDRIFFSFSGVMLRYMNTYHRATNMYRGLFCETVVCRVDELAHSNLPRLRKRRRHVGG